MSRERHTSALRAHNGHGDGASFRAGPATASVTRAHRLTRMAPKYHASSRPHADSRTLRASTGSIVPDKVAQCLVLAQLW